MKEGMTKDDLFNFIKSKAQMAHDESYTDLYFYYTGHGSSTDGAWIVDIGNDPSIDLDCSKITISDILDAIHQSDFKRSIYIESDSCYSGHLCY